MCPTPKEDPSLAKPANATESTTKAAMAVPIDTATVSSPARGLQTRHIILVLCMLTNAISYTMRLDINMTIVSMVHEEVNNQTDLDTCLANEFEYEYFQSNRSLAVRYSDAETPSDGFDWSQSLQGTILGAFYYGYILTMAYGGQLADLIGTKLLITIAVTACGLGTLAIPASAYVHPYLVVAVRVMTGVAQGVVTPALYTILPHWTPKNELGMAFGLIQASGNMGAVLTMPICGFLAEYLSWPWVFYFFGSLALLFTLPWLYFVYNEPDHHPRCSPAERLYINSNLSISTGKRKTMVPWRSILTSPKIWAIAVSRFCNGWGSLFLISKLPTYLKTILHMPITYNGYVNSSIYIALGGSSLVWGYVSDFVGRKQWLSRTVSRKLFQSMALFGGAFFLALIPLVGCNIIAIILCLNFSMILIGLTAGGESLVVVDVAPDYSGSIYGFTNSMASLPGFLAPLFVGIMLDQPNANPMKQWNILFGIGAAVYAFGAFVFIFGVNAEAEKWGRAPDNVDSVEKSKGDYEKSSGSNQVSIDINNNQ